MFPEVHPPVAIRRWFAVWTAVLGAFALGLFLGEVLWARPFDWTLDTMQALFTLGLTIWCALKATKSDTPPHS